MVVDTVLLGELLSNSYTILETIGKVSSLGPLLDHCSRLVKENRSTRYQVKSILDFLRSQAEEERV